MGCSPPAEATGRLSVATPALPTGPKLRRDTACHKSRPSRVHDTVSPTSLRRRSSTSKKSTANPSGMLGTDSNASVRTSGKSKGSHPRGTVLGAGSSMSRPAKGAPGFEMLDASAARTTRDVVYMARMRPRKKLARRSRPYDQFCSAEVNSWSA